MRQKIKPGKCMSKKQPILDVEKSAYFLIKYAIFNEKNPKFCKKRLTKFLGWSIIKSEIEASDNFDFWMKPRIKGLKISPARIIEFFDTQLN